MERLGVSYFSFVSSSDDITSIHVYIITQVILAFWLVLAYDLLKDRCTIDVIIAKFLSLCFQMAESCENLASILYDWAKDKSKTKIVDYWTSARSRD